MKPSEISSSLQLLTRIQKPAFLWGAPGVGKSQVVGQVAAALGVRLIDIRAILLDPVDLRGLPTVEHGKAAWAIPAFLPEDGAGILFLDELNAAPPLVQAACYQLVLDRALGEYRLPDGWTVFAAGNREGDRAVTSRMSSALANRFVHLTFDADLDDWSIWAMGPGDLRPEVVAFLRWRPELLHRFEPAEKAFPSPRAWASVSHILAASPSAEIEFALYEGTVGRGAAIEFTGFLRVFRSLPSLDGILLNPSTAPVPNEPSALCAVATGLARRATEQNFGAIADYAGRLAREYGTLLVKSATARAHPRPSPGLHPLGRRQRRRIGLTPLDRLFDLSRALPAPFQGNPIMSITTHALGERAMLVALSVSIWSARKHDVRISDKVAAEHGADRSMGHYAKHLIPRELLATVNAANTALRDHHNLNTLAWGDDGTRILPAANYLGYQEQQQKLEDAFGRAVRNFVASYPDYVETARKALNGLFDPKDYPAPARINEKFGVRRSFMPVAQPDDFRVRLGDAHVAQIRGEIEARNAELIDNANRDLWQRVQEVTSRLVERLSAFQVDPVTGGRGHPFRDSLIENVRSLLEIMPRLNITGDAGIERVRQELAENVARHEPDALREDPYLRAKVVDAASGILAQMEGYC